jgi:hypothetical protein
MKLRDPEKEKIKWKKYYYENLDKERARRRKYYYSHTEIERAKERRKRSSKPGKYATYRVNALKRGLVFELSFEDFLKFWQQPCHYCGDSIETIGLDRVDNTKGYSPDNVVSCCTRCNRMKLKEAYADFIDRCIKVAKKHCAYKGININ